MSYTDILTRQKDIGISKYNHEILVKGSDLETCKRKTLHFFRNYQLVRYSQINILKDLQELPQGYKSKILHVITHLLDGFFGIDTYFYNLEEDSHWVSEELKEKIKTNPPIFWLLSLEAQI